MSIEILYCLTLAAISLPVQEPLAFVSGSDAVSYYDLIYRLASLLLVTSGSNFSLDKYAIVWSVTEAL